MKTSPSHRLVIVPFILLSRLFQSEPALADGCPAPSFAAAHTFDAGVSPFWVAVGDFNGDGKLDLVTEGSVLLGNGDGTFKPAVNFSTGASPISVAVGDFNRDGKPDLAVANRGPDNVSVLLGNGDGTFQPSINYGVA